MKSSLQTIKRAALSSIALLAAFSGSADERRGSPLLTALGSTTIGGYVSTGATFGSPADSSLIAGVIGQAQAQRLVFVAGGSQPLGGSASYPMLRPTVIDVEPFGPRVIPVDAYGPPGVVTPFPSPVPEPSTITLLIGGAVSLFFAVRRRGRRP
jgi:hypothetical protein